MRAKFTFAISLLILATVLLWWFMQRNIFRKSVAQAHASKGSGAALVTPTAMPSSAGSNEAEPNQKDRSTFVALRYDKTRVLFLLDELDGIAPDDQLSQRLRIMDSPVAKLAPAPVWESDEELVKDYQTSYGVAHTGEEWHLQLSSRSNLPVVIQKPVVVEVGCNIAAGFLAEIPMAQRETFAASSRQYFLISRDPAPQPSQPAQIAELNGWRATPVLRKQIEQLLQAKLREELPKVRHDAEDEYKTLDDATGLQWTQIDESLARGEGKLEYDIQAFQLTPDRTPRFFVRAKWTVGDKPSFLIRVWLRTEPSLAIQSIDSSASLLQRSLDFQSTKFDLDSLGQVLNVFDDGDGHGSFLFYDTGPESFFFTLYRYNAAGPVATNVALEGGC